RLATVYHGAGARRLTGPPAPAARYGLPWRGRPAPHGAARACGSLRSTMARAPGASRGRPRLRLATVYHGAGARRLTGPPAPAARYGLPWRGRPAPHGAARACGSLRSTMARAPGASRGRPRLRLATVYHGA